MDLSFGTNVLEHGYSIGRLAGFETDRQGRAVRNIIVSDKRTIDSQSERRPLVSVPADHFTGDIVLHAFRGADDHVGADDWLVLSDSTRVMRAEHQLGCLIGLEVSPETGDIVAIVGRQHWWTKRFRVAAPALDYSVPGIIRVHSATSRAA